MIHCKLYIYEKQLWLKFIDIVSFFDYLFVCSGKFCSNNTNSKCKFPDVSLRSYIGHLVIVQIHYHCKITDGADCQLKKVWIFGIPHMF